ncbi:MAG: hypothetical protein IT226_15495 [Flavobacteriales bacterium]|nr:hypothetical protein [Flavobacteriales bacterium]
MRSLFLLYSLALVLGALAQAPAIVHLRTELITVDDGLPQGLVHTLLQDRQGFLWMGTKDGLARYDGYHFMVFRNDPADSSSICGNRVNTLLEDRDGLIWAGNEMGCVSAYEPRTGRARSYDSPPTLLLRQDSVGRAWMISSTGKLLVLDRRTGSRAFRPAKELFAAWPGIEHAVDLEVESNGRIWITDAQALWCLAPEADGDLRLVSRQDLPSCTDPIGLPISFNLIPDPRNERYLLAACNDLLQVKWSDGKLVSIAKSGASPIRWGHLLDAKGRMWCSLFDQQLVRMDTATGSVEWVELDVQANDPQLAHRGQWPVIADRQGNVWLGSAGYGAFQVQASAERFHVREPMGYLVSNDAEGRYLITAQDFHALDGPDPWTAPMRTRIDALRAACCVLDEGEVDRLGRLWLNVSIQDAGRNLIRVVDRDGHMLPVPLGDRSCQQILSGPDGLLMVCTSSGPLGEVDELLLIDPLDLQVRAHFPLPRLLVTDDYKPIGSSTIAPDGTIWMGTVAGLFALDPRTGTWRSWVKGPEGAGHLPGDMVLATCLDPDAPERYLWIGMEGQGLARMDQRTGEVKRWTTENGLPNNVVYAILPDDAGMLWMSTNRGLCRFDPRTGAMRVFTKEHGLPGNEFNRYSAARSRNGYMYFGGMDGVVNFDPAVFAADTVPSPTLITRLRLMNKVVTYRTDPELLPSPISQLRELVLPYDTRMITFDLASTDQTAPALNEFRYQLEGLDTTWVESGTAHEATYTNLDPGQYTFRVQSRNSAGVWDRQGASLALVITPPWWGTWWFRSLMVLALAGLLYALYRYRLAQQLRLVRVRDRIARDLHDEIGSTLSSVALFSEVAKRRSDAAETGRNDMLDRISSSTSEMVESMNDIVWAVNSRNDELLHVAQRMQEFGGRVAEAVGFELDFSFEGIDEDQELDMVQRKNLYLIFKEAVNNAAKYSGCSNLVVRVGHERREVVLRISDDGKGMGSTNGAPMNGTSGGNGLKNMQARAQEIGGVLNVESAPGAGTTVELRFKP